MNKTCISREVRMEMIEVAGQCRLSLSKSDRGSGFLLGSNV